MAKDEEAPNARPHGTQSKQISSAEKKRMLHNVQGRASDSRPTSSVPATEMSIQIESCGAVAFLEVGEELGDDVDPGRNQAGGNPNQTDDDPGLGPVIRSSQCCRTSVS
jgi:hypothetical protein